MKLKVKLTNRAILRSGEDMEGDSREIVVQISDLPHDVRLMLADRLLEDAFVCVASVDEAGGVEPGLTADGFPDLLCLDGTEVRHLIEALRQDDEEVKAYRAEVMATEG